MYKAILYIVYQYIYVLLSIYVHKYVYTHTYINRHTLLCMSVHNICILWHTYDMCVYACLCVCMAVGIVSVQIGVCVCVCLECEGYTQPQDSVHLCDGGGRRIGWKGFNWVFHVLCI